MVQKNFKVLCALSIIFCISCYNISGTNVFVGDYIVKTQSDLDELEGYIEITGRLEITSTILNNLDGLESLETIGGALWIIGNERLENIHGLSNLRTVGSSFILRSNKSLCTLNGLESLTLTGSTFQIESNYKLCSISALSSLVEVNRRLYVGYNEDLLSLAGLENLTDLKGNLQIESNGELPQCEAVALKDRLINECDWTGSAMLRGNNYDKNCDNPVDVDEECHCE